MFRGKFLLFLRVFNLPIWYNSVPKNILIVNFIFQRIFRINSDIPFSINFRNRIRGIQNIKLNDETKKYLAWNSGIYITAFNNTNLTIGDNTLIASNVAIQTGNHGLFERDNYTLANVKIGKNCWIGFGAVILPGVVLGNNVTVGANAVVTKSFPDNVVLGGSPAKIIKKINKE